MQLQLSESVYQNKILKYSQIFENYDDLQLKQPVSFQLKEWEADLY